MKSSDDVTLYVYITYFENSKSNIKAKNNRVKYLANLLLSIAYISVKEVHVKIFTNSISNELTNILDPIKAKESTQSTAEIIHIDQSKLRNNLGEFEPHLLTWAHKDSLKKDFINSRENSYFLYLEDDAIFTQSNLEYFMSKREELRGIGLIPSFLRVEWSCIHSDWINSDSFERLPNALSKNLLYHADHVYMEVRNPYCALILLDKELAEEYLNSESSKVETARLKHDFIWDTAATSALGLIAEKIPHGHSSRTVVGLGSQTMLPLIGSIVRHQGDKYGNEIWWKHFRAFDDNSKPTLPSPKRSLLEMFKRVWRDPMILKNQLITFFQSNK